MNSKVVSLNKETIQPAVQQDGDGPKLSEEDLARVRQVTSSGINAVERKPFKVWKLLLIIVGSIVFLGQLSIFVASFYLNE